MGFFKYCLSGNGAIDRIMCLVDISMPVNVGGNADSILWVYFYQSAYWKMI